MGVARQSKAAMSAYAKEIRLSLYGLSIFAANGFIIFFIIIKDDNPDSLLFLVLLIETFATVNPFALVCLSPTLRQKLAEYVPFCRRRSRFAPASKNSKIINKKGSERSGKKIISSVRNNDNDNDIVNKGWRKIFTKRIALLDWPHIIICLSAAVYFVAFGCFFAANFDIYQTCGKRGFYYTNTDVGHCCLVRLKC